jgi:hypothetical protein
MDDYPLLGLFVTMLWFFLFFARGASLQQREQDYVRSAVNEPAA